MQDETFASSTSTRQTFVKQASQARARTRRRASGVLIVIVALTAIFVFAGCGDTNGDETAGGDTLERGSQDGSLRLAFMINRPLAFIDEEGELAGSGIDVAGTVLERLDIPEFEPVLTSFDGLIPGLNGERWDMSAFPFYITAERCEEAAFTNPMAQYPQGALVREGNPENIHSYADMVKNPDITVAFQAGAAEIEYAKEVGMKSSQMATYPEELLAIQAVQAGRADAYVNATFVLAQAEENYDIEGLEAAEPFTGPIIDGEEQIAYGGWALRHEDGELREAFNAELADMLKNGELQELQKPWGYTQDMLPPQNLTAEDLCPDAPWQGTS